MIKQNEIITLAETTNESFNNYIRASAEYDSNLKLMISNIISQYGIFLKTSYALNKLSTSIINTGLISDDVKRISDIILETFFEKNMPWNNDINLVSLDLSGTSKCPAYRYEHSARKYGNTEIVRNIPEIFQKIDCTIREKYQANNFFSISTSLFKYQTYPISVIYYVNINGYMHKVEFIIPLKYKLNQYIKRKSFDPSAIIVFADKDKHSTFNINLADFKVTLYVDDIAIACSPDFSYIKSTLANYLKYILETNIDYNNISTPVIFGIVDIFIFNIWHIKQSSFKDEIKNLIYDK